jgi:hypothetical protein
MAKMARENKLRERRAEKQARKDARKFAAANPQLDDEADEQLEPGDAASAPAEPAGPPET